MLISKKSGNNYSNVLFKVFLVAFWAILTYQGLHLQCCDTNSYRDQPPIWQVQNSVVNASKNQICCLRSYIFLYFCSKVDLKSYSKRKSSFDVFLLLLSGDVEVNPGPENWYSLQHPKMCGFFRTTVYLVFECQKLIPKNENDFAFVEVKQGFSDMRTLFKDHFDANQIDLKSLKKNISRFQKFNKKQNLWQKNKV